MQLTSMKIFRIKEGKLKIDNKTYRTSTLISREFEDGSIKEEVIFTKRGFFKHYQLNVDYEKVYYDTKKKRYRISYLDEKEMKSEGYVPFPWGSEPYPLIALYSVGSNRKLSD